MYGGAGPHWAPAQGAWPSQSTNPGLKQAHAGRQRAAAAATPPAADYATGYSGYCPLQPPPGRVLQESGAQQPARQLLCLDPFQSAHVRLGGGGAQYTQSSETARRAAAAAAGAAQVSALPGSATGDYLDSYRGVKSLLQKFKNRGQKQFPLAVLNEYITRLSLQVEFRMEKVNQSGGFLVEARLASKKDGKTIEVAVGRARKKQAGKQVAAAALLQKLLDSEVLDEQDLLAPSAGKEDGKKKKWQAPQRAGLGSDANPTYSGYGGSRFGSFGHPGNARGFVRGGIIVPSAAGFELEPSPGSAAARGGYGAVSVSPFVPQHRPSSLKEQLCTFQAASLPNADKQFTSSGAVRSSSGAVRSSSPHQAGHSADAAISSAGGTRDTKKILASGSLPPPAAVHRAGGSTEADADAVGGTVGGLGWGGSGGTVPGEWQQYKQPPVAQQQQQQQECRLSGARGLRSQFCREAAGGGGEERQSHSPCAGNRWQRDRAHVICSQERQVDWRHDWRSRSRSRSRSTGQGRQRTSGNRKWHRGKGDGRPLGSERWQPCHDGRRRDRSRSPSQEREKGELHGERQRRHRHREHTDRRHRHCHHRHDQGREEEEEEDKRSRGCKRRWEEWGSSDGELSGGDGRRRQRRPEAGRSREPTAVAAAAPTDTWAEAAGRQADEVGERVAETPPGSAGDPLANGAAGDGRWELS